MDSSVDVEKISNSFNMRRDHWNMSEVAEGHRGMPHKKIKEELSSVLFLNKHLCFRKKCA